MLGKLIKYELLADWKKYGIVSAALLLVSIMLLITNKMSHHIANMKFVDFVTTILVFTFFAAAICAVGMLFVFSTTRFYKSFIRDEGYLTHTLPVHIWQLIASKIIAVYIWFIGLAVILAICVGIAAGEPLWLFHYIRNGSEVFSLAADRFGTEATQSLIRTAFSGVLMLLFMPAIYMARICLCFALGNLFSKNKLAMAVVMFFAVSFAERILYTIVSFHYFSDLISMTMAETASDEQLLLTSVSAVQVSLILSLIIMVGSLIASERIFAKRLNLE